MKRLAFLLLLMALSLTAGAQSVEQFAREQISRYPQSRLLDLYKSCFQDFMGPEHLVADTLSARRYLDYELAQCPSDSLPLWLYESCGLRGQFVRVSLRVVKQGYVSADALLSAFIRSANETPRPDVEAWRRTWHAIADSLDRLHLPLSHYADDRQLIDNLLAAGHYALSHSPEYRKAYRPHYRIVSRDIFLSDILPCLPKDAEE